MFEPIITDPGNHMLLTVVIAAPGRIAGEPTLSEFWAVPPAPITVTAPDLRFGVVDHTYEALQRADEGDAASQHRMRGLGLMASGDLPGALVEFERASALGDAAAMKDAGDVCNQLHRRAEAQAWFLRAADAGDPFAMWNLGALAFESGDREVAAGWYRQCANTGTPSGTRRSRHWPSSEQIASGSGGGRSSAPMPARPGACTGTRCTSQWARTVTSPRFDGPWPTPSRRAIGATPTRCSWSATCWTSSATRVRPVRGTTGPGRRVTPTCWRRLRSTVLTLRQVGRPHCEQSGEPSSRENSERTHPDAGWPVRRRSDGGCRP